MTKKELVDLIADKRDLSAQMVLTVVEDFMKIIENKELIQNIKNLGFRFVTLDLEGIRSGGYDIENTRNSTKG